MAINRSGNLFFVLLISLALMFIIGVDGGPQQEKKRTPARHGSNGSGTAKECHYTKSPWSECNTKTNMRTRTLTLRKTDDENKCEKTKTIDKKCKRVCKYDKGTWSKCNAQNEMTRTDSLKNAIEVDPSCDKTKVLTKKCKSKLVRSGKGQKRNNKHPKHQQQSDDLHQKSSEEQSDLAATE